MTNMTNSDIALRRRMNRQMRAIDSYAHFCGFDKGYVLYHWCERDLLGFSLAGFWGTYN